MRTALSSTVALLLVQAVPAAAQDTVALDRARMYPQPAAQVWKAALDTLAALKLKTDEVDAAHQFVVTKFRAYGDSSVAGPDVPGYRPQRFQLHVFVSPFAEPARVHVASVSELQKIHIGAEVAKMHENDRSAEEMAIKGYNESIRLAVEVGDNGTRELLEGILKEEEDHIDNLEAQLDQIKQMGIAAYLTEQLD